MLLFRNHRKSRNEKTALREPFLPERKTSYAICVCAGKRRRFRQIGGARISRENPFT
jgi:hypothetical protein